MYILLWWRRVGAAVALQDLRFALHQTDQPTATLLLRAAFHDAATYCHTTADGGADGSIRLELSRVTTRCPLEWSSCPISLRDSKRALR